MSVPTVPDVKRMRADVERTFSDRCAIRDPGGVETTPSGGTTLTGPTIDAPVSCRLSASGGQAAAREFGEQLASAATFLLTFAYVTRIQVGWTVTVDGVDGAFTVTAVRRSGATGAATRVLLSERTAVGG